MKWEVQHLECHSQAELVVKMNDAGDEKWEPVHIDRLPGIAGRTDHWVAFLKRPRD